MYKGVILVALVALTIEEPTKKKTKKIRKPPPPTELVIENIGNEEDCERSTKNGNVLYVHYIGRFYDTDEEFDNSYERERPFEFVLGEGQVIKGWDQGLVNMCRGEKRRLTVPAKLAYGKRGVADLIPPHAALVFDIELVDFKYKNIPKKLTAKDRVEKKKKAWKRKKMMSKMDMETRADGSQVVNFAGFSGDSEEDDDYEGFEL